MSIQTEQGFLVVPGTRLDEATDKRTAGSGTYLQEGYIYASLCGALKITENNGIETLTILSPKATGILPIVGDVVTAVVTVVNSRLVQCAIKCVRDQLLASSYRGVIKKEDIRDTEKDRCDPYKSYRPGDVILARVMPITEVHWYYLTTAENQLGVVIASAEGDSEGVHMIPISWTEMQCPKTMVKESRKVAKVLPENINEALIPKKER